VACLLAIVGSATASLVNAQIWPNLPVSPISLQAVGDPNIALTIDDSGSMSWDAVPDSKTGAQVRRRFAADWNSLSYNPFTVYEAPYSTALDGTKLVSTFAAAPINGYNAAGGTANLSNNYQSHWAYTSGNLGCYGSCTAYGAGQAAMDDRGTLGGAFAVGPAFFYVFFNSLGPGNVLPAPGTDASTFVRNVVAPGGCAGLADVNNDACYVRKAVTVTHEQNYANWYSFYRTRHLATITGANLAFYDLPLNYRVTWQNLTRCTAFNSANCLGWDDVARANPIRPFTTAAHRQRFFEWLQKVPHHFGTPLVQAMERAGAFYTGSAAGVESSIANQPGISLTGPGTAPTSTCRPNYHVMMTDGLWNGGASGRGNVDNTAIAALPDGTPYLPAAPYRDTTAGTLADVAFHYWSQDAQPGLANDLERFYKDPTLDLTFNNPKNDPATWQHMVNFTIGLGLGGFLDGTGGRLLWGGDTYSGSYANLASGATLWPAATSGSANTVSDLWHAAINSRGEFFNVANPTSLRDAFKSIIGRINAGQTTSGQLGTSSRRVQSGTLSFDLIFDPNTWSGSLRAFNVNADGSLAGLAWTSDTTFTSGAGRSIFSWDTATQLGESFAWGSYSNAEKFALFNNNQDLFNYLAGDRSLEGPTFRRRAQLLGDSIGSDLVVGARSDLGYSVLAGTAGTTYKAHVALKKPVAYFGSNDGMLHAFRNNGNEAFAYIPSNLLPKLKDLATNPFVHAPRVDGPIVLGDAYLNGAWRSILLGGLGGGGKSFFGLDVTNVATSTSGTFGASNVMFELNDVDIGYTFARPAIARQTNGDWVAIFGNGYGGASKTAVLIVKNLTSGTITKIDTNNGTVADPNGLSSPTVLATQIGKAEGIYAGDYRGNLWKFAQNASGAWVIANAGQPIFVATAPDGSRQPITAAPTLEAHPAGGVMVLFGTGKFFETQDRTDPKVQTFYALRDRGVTIGTRAVLTAQTIQVGNSASATKRVVSENVVDYSSKAGWYLDLNSTEGGVATGEKVVASAAILNDTVAFSTFVPSSTTCTGLGSGFLMGLGTFTGRVTSPLYDDNGDGKADSGDLLSGKAVAGVRTASGSLVAPTAILVGLQTPGSSGIPAGACGGAGQSPCPPGDVCRTGLIVKAGVCQPIACPSGSVMVNNQRCFITSKRATWFELR